MISVVTIQVCPYIVIAARDNTQTYGHVCIAIKFYLQKQEVGWIRPPWHDLSVPGPGY